MHTRSGGRGRQKFARALSAVTLPIEYARASPYSDFSEFFIEYARASPYSDLSEVLSCAFLAVCVRALYIRVRERVCVCV
jgi:hypothetical protein